MVITNILYDGDEIPEELKKYDLPYIKLANSIDECLDKKTLVYGKKLANRLFGKQSGGKNKINQFFYWTYSHDEIRSECWVDKFVSILVKDFFFHNEMCIDPVFNNTNVVDMPKMAGSWPLLHNGKYEIYAVQTTSSKSPNIYSVKKESIKYCGMDPEKIIYDMIDVVNGKCLVLSTNDVNILKCKKEPIFLQDLYLSSSGKMFSMIDIHKMFGKQISKQDILIYIMSITRHLYENVPLILTNGI